MKIIFYIRTNTGCPVFLTACCYLVIGNPAVIIMRLKYNVHSLIYSKPIFEEKREPENKKIFLFVLFLYRKVRLWLLSKRKIAHIKVGRANR